MNQTAKALASILVLMTATACTPKIPETVGMTGSAAERLLRNSGYESKTIQEVSETNEAGKIIKSIPAGGTAEEKGKSVTLYIAKSRSINGNLELVDLKIRIPSIHPDLSCKGEDGYSDIYGGAPITVKDSKGNLIAVSKLQTGVLGDRRQTESSDNFIEYYNSCNFTFSIEDLPRSDFYQIRIGSRELSTSRSELISQKWSMSLTLGD